MQQEPTADNWNDRYEPAIGLARTYMGLGLHGLASYHASLAAKLKGDAPEVRTVQAALPEMLKGAPPADLATLVPSAEILWVGGYFA